MITNTLLLAAILTLAKIHSYFERIVDKYKNIEEIEATEDFNIKDE